MLCPKCNQPLGIQAAAVSLAVEDIVREHAEDYGYVKLPSVEWLTTFLKPSESNRVDARDVARTLHSALQGGKHA